MKKLTMKFTVVMLVCLSVLSCKKEESDNTLGTYAEAGAAIVVNEGNYGSNWSCPNLTDIFSWSRVSLDL